MIHHLSIPAKNPLHVTKVLVELFGGVMTEFGPYQDSYIAWGGDEYGTAIEVYPLGTEMFPDSGDGQANFKHNAGASPFVATHATVSIELSKTRSWLLHNEKDGGLLNCPEAHFGSLNFGSKTM